MRNHEMVYFFYDQAPMYNRDKYHKRIQAKNETINNVVGNITNAGNPEGASNFTNGNNGKFFEPPNPVSVLEDKLENDWGFNNATKSMKTFKNKQAEFEPKLPASVLEQMDEFGWSTGKLPKENRGKEGFEPKLPVSVIEEKYNSSGYKKELVDGIKNFGTNGFEPPNPASVVEEKDEFGWDKSVVEVNGNKIGKIGGNFEPVNPVSVLEEDEPVTMFESTKVFIGKRHHQTEKPQDILEFFLKYWSNEGDTILDPTMGSGSTGVACNKLNRKFIGIELDENIFKVAEKRNINEKTKLI